jgi:hypothetical protein
MTPDDKLLLTDEESPPLPELPQVTTDPSLFNAAKAVPVE